MKYYNLYLDIDGVILTPKDTKPSQYSKEFLEYVIENFNCFWLTTHCKGESNSTISYLSKYFNDEAIQLFKKIKPTTWTTLKTEGIDFNSDFVWLDDYPFKSEKEILKQHSCLDSLIEIDLNRDNELINVLQKLRNLK